MFNSINLVNCTAGKRKEVKELSGGPLRINKRPADIQLNAPKALKRDGCATVPVDRMQSIFQIDIIRKTLEKVVRNDYIENTLICLLPTGWTSLCFCFKLFSGFLKNIAAQGDVAVRRTIFRQGGTSANSAVGSYLRRSWRRMMNLRSISSDSCIVVTLSSKNEV